jgi:hypothetical protein
MENYTVVSGAKFNALYTGQIFFKLTNSSEIHNGFHFKTGLNVDHQEFYPKGKCSQGGIYFCNKKDFMYWIHYGNTFCFHYRIVTIPDDARVYCEGDKFKADKLILSERNEIWSDNELCIAAVATNGAMLEYVNGQTDDICKTAVSNYGFALQYVQNQTEDICKAAVSNNGFSLQYVYKQTDDICKTAVSNDGFALQYVQNQTDDICKAAVLNDEYALEYVRNQTDDICKAAVQKNGYAISCVKKQTDELCHIAIKENSSSIFRIHNPTNDMYKSVPCTIRVLCKIRNGITACYMYPYTKLFGDSKLD